jgi:hypothetical protein
MSGNSKARLIQRELGWRYTRALRFVRTYSKEAMDLALEDGTTVKEALLTMAREQQRVEDDD